MDITPETTDPFQAIVSNDTGKATATVDVMDAVCAEELRSVHPSKQQEAYEELHGVFVGSDGSGSGAFQETHRN